MIFCVNNLCFDRSGIPTIQKVIHMKHPVQNGVGEGIKEMTLKISELQLLILQFRNNYRVNFLRLVGTEKRKSR